MSETNVHNQPACTVRFMTVTAADLPLSCPLPVSRLWDAHPRVYLPIEEQGQVLCPYCSTMYVLEEK